MNTDRQPEINPGGNTVELGRKFISIVVPVYREAIGELHSLTDHL